MIQPRGAPFPPCRRRGRRAQMPAASAGLLPIPGVCLRTLMRSAPTTPSCQPSSRDNQRFPCPQARVSGRPERLGDGQFPGFFLLGFPGGQALYTAAGASVIIRWHSGRDAGSRRATCVMERLSCTPQPPSRSMSPTMGWCAQRWSQAHRAPPSTKSRPGLGKRCECPSQFVAC